MSTAEGELPPPLPDDGGLATPLSPSDAADYGADSAASARAFYLSRRFSVLAADCSSPTYALSDEDANALLSHPFFDAYRKTAAVDLAFEECGPDMAESLYSAAWGHMKRRLTSGLAYEHTADRGFKSWVFMLNLNACLDARREELRMWRDAAAAVRSGQAGANLAAGDTIVAAPSTGSADAIDYTAWGAILDIIRTLPDDQQQAVLREINEESGKQVAERLGVSQARVSQLKSEAVKVIRDHLRKAGYDVPPAGGE